MLAAQRANTTSAFLHRNIRTCPRKTKHLAYTTLVHPILEYASIIWDPHTASNINKLETVQRRSARHIMHNYSRHASVTTMLSQHLDLPTLQQCRQHSKIIMLYRITHKLASIPTATYIAPCILNTQHYILPYARTHVLKTSFFPSTIKIWNNLHPIITNSTTIPQLRGHVNKKNSKNPKRLWKGVGGSSVQLDIKKNGKHVYALFPLVLASIRTSIAL